MLPVNQYLKKYIYRIIFCVCIFLPIGAQANILTFDSILSQGENNGDKHNGGSWTTLKFKILNPVVGTRRYLNRSSISFTIDSDRNINRTRSDIRIGTDWLRNRKFKSANNKWNNIWVGSGSLNGAQLADIRTFDNDEKVVFAWIIANSDELINYSLSKHKNMPKRSRLTWERMSRDQKFERNVRRFLGPSARAALKKYDEFKHSKLALKRIIQPNLKGLGYYDGAIDGIPGPRTKKAIKAFEKENNLLVDGIIRGKERTLLTRLAIKKSKQNQRKKTTTFDNKKIVGKEADLEAIAANQRKIIKTLRLRISELNKESTKNKGTLIQSLKNEKMASDQKFFDLNKGTKKLEVTAENQRNIIKSLRRRITQLTSERNNYGISENNQELNKQIIKNLRQRISELAKQRNDSKSVEAYKDLENLVQGQKNVIKNLRKRAAVLIKERNKYRDNAKNKSDGSTGGSNKYLITSLENELNSLQIRYDVILKQRDKFRKAATQGDTELSATADNQKNTIETLRKRISSLVKERNTLQSSLDSSAGNSSADKNQLSKLQNKYQKLYIENNDIKINFNKLNRKYEQLSLNLKSKNNKDTEKLQRLNEELSLSLQKQKILAYDAISQKSEVERKLKIAQTETMELNSQINDFSNTVNVNGALKNDLSLARSQINALNDKLDAVSDSASSELSKSVSKIKALELELEKSKNKFAELEKQNSLTKNGRQKGFVLSSEWDELKQWITPQQIRFCTILSDYDREKVSAQESGNQLKQNLAIDNRDADIDALLLGRNSQEKGYFRNWIGTVEQVFAIYQENADGVEELAAGVVIKTPCNSVTVGSGRVKSADDERYEGTAFPSDPIYTQLSQVSKGDPILFEGSLLTYQDTGEAKRSSKPRFFTNVDSSVNDAEAEIAKKRDKINAPDYFVKIDYLSKL